MRNKVLTLAMVVGLSLPTAQAQVFQDLFRGFQIAGTPTGSPVGFGPAGSQANGSRIGRTRVVPNRFGQGYRLEFDRSFGTDVFGRPEVFDFGNLELELSGAMSMTAGYTTRGIPQGDAQYTLTGLSYDFRSETGAQDFSLRGVLDVNSDLSINPLGFYEASVQVNNTNASLEAEGLAIDGDVDTDFDIGPISIRGNVYFDLFVAALASFGVDVSGVVGVFPDSPIDRIVEEIQTSLADQAAVLGDTILAEEGDQITAEFRSLDQTFSLTATVLDTENQSSRLGPVSVPEPATMALLAAGGLLLLRRR